MKVTCCKCGQVYGYEYGMTPEVITETIDLKDGNVVHRTKCPFCGLEHNVIWTKIGKWKE